MFDEPGHGARSGGGAGKHGRPAPNVTRIPLRADGSVGAFLLGGNANTLAFVSSLRGDQDIVTAYLVPVAQTPLGTVVGEGRQNVGIAMRGLLDWIDQTFPADDEAAFIAPVRDIELLLRINWEVEPPERLDESNVLNIEDAPPEIVDALAHPAEGLVQCAVCRRSCVRDHFVWNERQLCAWDYHHQVFGKRGPWHTGPYEERHYATLPRAAYVAPPLLEEEGAEVVMAVAGLDEGVARAGVDAILRADPASNYIAVLTLDGYTLLREKR